MTTRFQRLALPLLIVGVLAGAITWAEFTSWRQADALERALAAPGLQELLDRSANWPASERDGLEGIVIGSRETVASLRRWLIASCAGVLVLGALIAGIVEREMIRPLERQLVETNAVIARQEKLVSLGVLAAGVAHEIRNPLTAIKARLFTLKRKLDSNSPALAETAFIGGEIDRLERIVRDVLQFARPAEPALKTVAAGDLLRGVQEMMAPELAQRGVVVRLDAPGDLRVVVDPAQVKQALLNLIRNAAESMADGGTITLRARKTFAPFAPKRSDAIALEVEDTGPGIALEVRDRVFDPFFTTKESGTGLGLAIAERIAHKHGGLLDYRTQLGRGTIFSVILPNSGQ